MLWRPILGTIHHPQIFSLFGTHSAGEFGFIVEAGASQAIFVKFRKPKRLAEIGARKVCEVHLRSLEVHGFKFPSHLLHRVDA